MTNEVEQLMEEIKAWTNINETQDVTFGIYETGTMSSEYGDSWHESWVAYTTIKPGQYGFDSMKDYCLANGENPTDEEVEAFANEQIETVAHEILSEWETQKQLNALIEKNQEEAKASLPSFNGERDEKDSESRMGVTVYTKDNCQQCRMVKRLLNEKGVDYTEINIGHHPEAIDYLKSQGFLSVPVTEIKAVEAVAGFQPTRLKELAQLVSESSETIKETHPQPAL